jgi:hypothetical protein
VTAASARAFAQKHGLEDVIKKIVADAPPLSDATRDALQALWASPDATPRARSKKRKR